MNARLQALLGAGRLVARDSPDAQVAGLWRDGMGAYAYAVSTDGRPALRRGAVHDTARMASLALLRAANLRERVKGDHDTALTAAGLLGDDRLAELLATVRDLGSGGYAAEVGRGAEVSADNVAPLIPIAREILVRARDRLIALRPALDGALAAIPGESTTHG